MSKEVGRRLTELKRSGASGKHDTRPKGERDRHNRERNAIERNKKENE